MHDWICDSNLQNKFGFLNVNENELQVSEKVYSVGLSVDTVLNMIKELGEMAHNYRLQTFGC